LCTFAVALRKESVDRNVYIGCDLRQLHRVALRKESVDRNTNFFPASLFDLSSLSARRAWIEIQNPRKMILSQVSRSPQGERG